jgi:hypothetical protein
VFYLQWGKQGLKALLLISLLGLYMLASEVSVSEGAASEVKLAPVYLNDSSYVELQDAYVIPLEKGGRQASFTLIVHNTGEQELQFNDYWVRLRTESGGSYMVQLLPQDKNKSRIPARAKESFTFYSKVSSNVNVTELIIQVFKWDFASDHLERIVGEFSIPQEGYTVTTPQGTTRAIVIAGVPVETSVSRVSMNHNEKYTQATIYVDIENKGELSFDVPDYRHYIRTSDGLMYPLELYQSTKNSKVHPGESKEIQLTALVPATVEIGGGWELLTAQTITKSNGAVTEQLVVPLASYELATSEQDEASVNEPVEFSTYAGIYQAKLNAIQRLPWEENDLLAASITLSNFSQDSLPIPELTGYFLFDDAVKVSAKLVQTDELTGLSMNAYIHFQAIGEVSYHYQFTKVKFMLQEQLKDGTVNDAAEFFHSNELQSIPKLMKYGVYNIKDIGRNSAYHIQNVYNYGSATTNLLVVNLEAENMEKRFSNLPKLAAYVRAADHTLYTVEAESIKQKINPKGKAIISLAAIIPKEFIAKDLELLVGEAVTGNKLSSLSETPDAFVQVAAFHLPVLKQEPQQNFKQINLFPYTVSFSSIQTSVDFMAGTLDMNFDMDVSKDLSAQTNIQDHKLIVEIKDEKVDVSYLHRMDLEVASSALNEQEGKVIELGKHKYQIRWNAQELLYRINFLNKFRINIYDEYRGHKRLLATQLVDWFALID